MPYPSILCMLIPQQSITRSVQTADKPNTNGGIFHARNQEHKDHITVDHGYGNIKTANTITPTGITAYESEPIFTRNILEYNGICYRTGEGHKEFIPDKAIDNYHVRLVGCSLYPQGYPAVWNSWYLCHTLKIWIQPRSAALVYGGRRRMSAP